MLPKTAHQQIRHNLQRAEGLYYRLVLLVAPAGAGKTAALHELQGAIPCKYVNLNLQLSQALLDLTERLRVPAVQHVLGDLAAGAGDLPLLLDNTELLFDPSLKQDPLKLLKHASRNTTIVAAWTGELQNGYLTYAERSHPEYKRYPPADLADLIVVSPEYTHP